MFMKNAIRAVAKQNNLVGMSRHFSQSEGIQFNGKRALITGGGSGIGKGIAECLLKCGAEVSILDNNDKAATAFKASEPSIEVISSDLLEVEDTIAKVNESMKANGPFSYLVSCAGLAAFQPYFETSPAKFDLQYGINVKPIVYLTQAIAFELKENKMPGSVVHISSQSSTIPLLDHLVYSSSKAAVDHCARI